MGIALITGASAGLGRALALSLAGEGWTVLADARGAARLDTVTGRGIHRIAGDVTDPAHRAALGAKLAELGGLDLLVNNASTLGPSPQPSLVDYPPHEWARVYEVNVHAPLALLQQTIPLLRKASGTVLNISSDAAVEHYPGWGGYGSAKAALDKLSAVLAEEEPGLRVYAFDPGDMRTEMHQLAFPGEDISDRPEPETVPPAIHALLAQRPPSGRYTAARFAGALR